MMSKDEKVGLEHAKNWITFPDIIYSQHSFIMVVDRTCLMLLILRPVLLLCCRHIVSQFQMTPAAPCHFHGF